ncbi:MAG: methyltransferase family protein [Cytophaga sp.]|uniref:methyltransferase family protein n=1 Tax=Cytophaga sp. TaxID=29535 RepID=UPI003F7F1932
MTQAYIGTSILALFISVVLIRSLSLKKMGIQAVEFGKKDKKDLIIPPFALFYFYLILAHTFNWPTIPAQLLFYSELLAWTGVVLCLSGLLFFIWTMISFKKSFRVGLVENTAQGLITSGAFAISRNPIYVSFAVLLIGQFCIYPSWIFLIYLAAGIATFHRQVIREEAFLKQQYGSDFQAYCEKVRRYI